MISFTDLGLTIVWYYAHASDRVPSVQAISWTGRLAIDVATCIGIVRSYGNNSRRKRYDLWENGVWELELVACMEALSKHGHGGVDSCMYTCSASSGQRHMQVAAMFARAAFK